MSCNYYIMYTMWQCTHVKYVVWVYCRSQIFRAKNIFVLKKFVVFNFRGWSQPWKLNTDHTLYVTLCTSTVSTATMDTLRSLERERRGKLILHEMVLQSPSLHQLLNVNRIGSWPRGVVKSTQMIDHRTSFVINYHLVGVTGIVDGSERENYRWSRSKHLGSQGSCMQNAHAQKYPIRNNLLPKKFCAFNGPTHENFLTTKISRCTVLQICKGKSRLG